MSNHKRAESAGKIPDAREEAERIVDAGKLTDPGGRVIAVAAFEDLIADIQKRTLLAAAHYDNVGVEELAKEFHRWYELLAPRFGYKTRTESAVEWDNVPEDNRELMMATALRVIESLNLCKVVHATK